MVVATLAGVGRVDRLAGVGGAVIRAEPVLPGVAAAPSVGAHLKHFHVGLRSLSSPGYVFSRRSSQPAVV
jgi:hypothetical protein